MGVKGSDTVDGVRADNRKISHSDLLVVTWVSLLQFLNVEVIDVVDQLQMSWQQSSNELDGPLLESLRQDRMVGVGEGMVANVPCLLEAQLLLINQDSKQLNGSNSWMRIIQLDLVLLGEEGESIIVPLLVSPEHVVDGCGAEEVLLLETELLAGVGRVIGVQHTRNILCLLPLSNGAVIVTGIEFIEI